jgi:hypothetical protein
MRSIVHLLAACVAGMLLAPGAAAAQSAPAPSTCPVAVAADSARPDSAGASADVVIVASATIQELRFNREPSARVRVLGCGEGEGLRVLERRNLPERIQPGVTYRDVYVSVRILGTLNAACIAALAGDSTAARGIVPGSCVSIGGSSPRASPPASAP